MHRNMNCADTGLIYRMYMRIFPFHGFLLATALVWFTERCGTVNINKKINRTLWELWENRFLKPAGSLTFGNRH